MRWRGRGRGAVLAGGAVCALLLLLRALRGGGQAPDRELHSLDLPHGTALRPPSLVPTATCTEGTTPNVVLLITSYVGHVELRSAHRRALPQIYLDTFNASRIFLLAQIPSNEKYITQNAIDDEARRFGDILQGTFVENYRNLTYKHLMGLHFGGSRCNNTKYIIKADDDTVFNFEIIYNLIIKLDPTDKLMAGLLMRNMKPHREKHNKWYVSEQEYPQPDYPIFLTGWLYVTTPATAISISRASNYHPYFWIDDIYVTGILTSALDVKPQSLGPEDIWLGYYELLECCLRDMVQRNIMCDGAVGPNGGRNNLIVEFYEALHKCEAEKNCMKRTEANRLRDTCIAQKERTLFGRGQSEVKIINLL